MMEGYASGDFAMMKLGAFTFSIRTAAYQDFSRKTEQRWPSQERFGQLPARQFTGPGDDSITLNGVIFGDYRGGTGQLDSLRLLASTGQPQILITGRGAILGRWVIESVEEKQSIFAAYGTPRKQEFTLTLKRFS